MASVQRNIQWLWDVAGKASDALGRAKVIVEAGLFALAGVALLSTSLGATNASLAIGGAVALIVACWLLVGDRLRTHLARREGASGLENWELTFAWGFDHVVADPDGEFEGQVWIRVKSTDGPEERILSCVVTHPDGSTSEANALHAGSAFYGSSLSRLVASGEDIFFYPDEREFQNPPIRPLTDGSYEVSVYAKSSEGPGRMLLKRGSFTLRDGQLVP